MAADRGRSRVRARAGSVRTRATISAVVVVGLALLVGSIALVSLMRETLTDAARTAAKIRADEVATVLEASQEPSLAVVNPEQLIQILDANGDVVASSSNVAGRPALARLRPGETAVIAAPIDDESFVAVARAAGTRSGRLTVIVARSLEKVDDATHVVTGLLLGGLPLLLLVVALTTFKLVGRVLAPVEAIRREVDEISAARLHRRVPEGNRRDEISRLASTMNRMLSRLDDSQMRQRRFVSDASHELRSPVASIRQHAEVALAHPDRTTTAELAETVLAEDLRVQRLVEDLLLLARADEETLAINLSSVDLDDLVFDEARRLRETTNLRIETTGVSAGRVLGDAAGLARALRNLGDNAARHARHRVAFGLGVGDGTVVLTVDDDGEGIPEGERERVFERFVRLDESRARGDGGSGLGLAIVAALVRAHGGTVTAGDGELGGARIAITLPPGTDAHG